MASVGFIGTEISNNQALSGVIELAENVMFAIEFPTTWPAGVTTISFQSKSTREGIEGVNNPGEVWRNVIGDNGTEITLTVGANRIVVLSNQADAFTALRFLRIRTGTSTTPVNVSPLQQLRIITKSF